LLAPRPTPKLEDHPSLSVRDCLFNIFPANLHRWKPFLHPIPEDAPCCDMGAPNMASRIRKYHASVSHGTWFGFYKLGYVYTLLVFALLQTAILLLAITLTQTVAQQCRSLPCGKLLCTNVTCAIDSQADCKEGEEYLYPGQVCNCCGACVTRSGSKFHSLSQRKCLRML
jgi:hypothetical protein